jgi:Short C-terminal domain
MPPLPYMLLIYIAILVGAPFLGYHLGKKKSIGGKGGVFLCILPGLLGLIGGFIGGEVLVLLGLLIVTMLPADKNDWEYNYEDEQKEAGKYTPPPRPDAYKPRSANDMKRLRYMKDTGAITEEEFERRKKELLR